MIAYLKLLRITNLAIIALCILLFYFLILVPVHATHLQTSLLPFTNIELALFVLSVLLIAAAGNVINDYFDFELDKQFKPGRPLSTGAISLDVALYLHAALAFGGIALGFYLGYNSGYYKVGYVYVICVVALYLYSAYLKKIALVGNIVIAALTGFVFLLPLLFEANFLNTIHFDAGQFAMNVLLYQAMFYGGFAFATNLAREIVKDLEDREGDDEHNIATLPVQYGDNVAKGVAILVLLALIGGLGYFMKKYYDAGKLSEPGYFIVAVVLPVLACIVLLFRAKQSSDYKRISMLLKVVMLLGVLSIPVFYWLNK